MLKQLAVSTAGASTLHLYIFSFQHLVNNHCEVLCNGYWQLTVLQIDIRTNMGENPKTFCKKSTFSRKSKNNQQEANIKQPIPFFYLLKRRNSNGVFYKSLFGRCVHEIFLSRFSEIIFQIAVKVSFTKNSVGVGVVSCYRSTRNMSCGKL